MKDKNKKATAVTKKSVPDTKKSSAVTKKNVSETKKPAPETKKPAPETKKPVPEIKRMVSVTEQKRQIPQNVLGVNLDEAALKALHEGKETELIKGFISQKSGRSFDAFLSLTSNNQIKFRFPEREKKNTEPRVNKLPKSVGGVELDEEDVADLKAGRETKLIMGIESKKKGKYYDAYLRWNEKKGIIFRFPGQDY